MKKVVEYKLGCKDYNVGDVVYLHRKEGKPSCRVIAINGDNDIWLFRPLSKQYYYFAFGGFISFGGKPHIYAKEIEIKKEAQQ